MRFVFFCAIMSVTVHPKANTYNVKAEKYKTFTPNKKKNIKFKEIYIFLTTIAIIR